MRRILFPGIAAAMLVVYLLSGTGIFRSLFSIENSFPKLQNGIAYIGEVKPIPGIGFAGGSLLLEVPSGNKDLIFISLLSENIQPEFHSLSRKVNLEAEESQNIFNPPQNLFGTYNCSLSAELALSGVLNGVLNCKNNTKTKFALKRIESVVKSAPTNTVITGILTPNLAGHEDFASDVINEAQVMLSNVKNIDLSSAALIKEKEKLEVLNSTASDARTMYSSASRIKEEVLSREKEVRALIDRRQSLQSQISELEKTRQQLIRSSGRGIEVQLAHRLNNLESGHFQKFLNSSEVDNSTPRVLNVSNYGHATDSSLEVVKENDASGPVAAASADADRSSVGSNPASVGKVEWWKQIE